MKNFQAADDTVAVVAITLTPDGLVTNCNSRKPQPHYDKFPGGRAKVGEKREAAVRRDLLERIAALGRDKPEATISSTGALQ